jgi:hypothetical protein
MTSWLLIEHPGPWPSDVLESTLPFPPERLERARAAGLRPLLTRRPGTHHRAPNAPRTVFVGCGKPGNRWLERLEIKDLAELATLDLDAVAEGRPGHGEPVTGPQFLVCTHGTKDMCCALFGRPVAAALARQHPNRTWEASHVGGDRWAANLLVTPDGFLHGHLTPAEATAVADAAVARQVRPDHLRGRTSAATPWEQCAEIAVRQHTGLRGLDAVLAAGIAAERDGASGTDARTVLVRAGEAPYAVALHKQELGSLDTSRCPARAALSDYVVDGIRRCR